MVSIDEMNIRSINTWCTATDGKYDTLNSAHTNTHTHTPKYMCVCVSALTANDLTSYNNAQFWFHFIYPILSFVLCFIYSLKFWGKNILHLIHYFKRVYSKYTLTKKNFLRFAQNYFGQVFKATLQRDHFNFCVI